MSALLLEASGSGQAGTSPALWKNDGASLLPWDGPGRTSSFYVNQRFNAGMGPLKIRYELRQKGIADELAEQCLDTFGERWDELLESLRRRKYGDRIPDDYGARMKQARFLQNRGFSPESVMRLFR